MSLSAAEAARLETWIVGIADALRGHAKVEAKGQWRFGTNRALVVYPDGWFKDFSNSKCAGRGAFALIRFERPSDAVEWAKDWLVAHPGEGNFRARPDSDDARAAEDAECAAFVRALHDGAATESPILDSYLTTTRRLPVLPEDRTQLRWLDQDRGDEGAMLAAFTDSVGAIVAVQLTYITPDGKKSPIEPARRTLRGPADWGRRGFIRLGLAGDKAYLTEGLEKGLAARLGGAEYVLVTGGITRRFELPVGVKEVVVIRDADEPGSDADQSLWRLIVRLLGQGLKVAVTSRPNEIAPKGAPSLKDADDLYRFDPELIPVLLNGANLEHGRLGSDVEDAILDEASWLDDVPLDRARKTIAASLLGMPTVGGFDDAIKIIRAARKKSAEEAGGKLAEDEPWPDPVLDVGAVMDEAATELRRYVVLDQPSLDAAVGWSAFAHLVHHEQLKINIAPRFAIQSSDPDMGKTTLLECLACLTPRSIMVGSTTASSVFRTIDASKPTYFVDEVDNLLHPHADPELRNVLNSGHRRRTAYVERVEKLPNGTFKVTRFSTFTPIAMAGIGQLSPTLQSRCIVTTLSKATSAEQPEHLIDGESDTLFVSRRKFVRWAQDLQALPRIDRPKELLNRKGDNWYPLRQIAYLAGGDWPARIHAAATRGSVRSSDPTSGVALLEDIWTVYYEAGRQRLPTQEILAKLIAREESPWVEANRGGSITPYYLREKLKPYFKSWEDNEELRKAREWREKGAASPSKGYAEDHFADAWIRHIQKQKPSVVRKEEEEASKARVAEDAEPATKDAEGGVSPSSMATGSATSATSSTEAETREQSTDWYDADGTLHPRPPHEYPRQPDRCRRSSADGRGCSEPLATEEHINNQTDKPSVGDVADVAAFWADSKGEGMHEDPIAHLRGAQSRKPQVVEQARDE
jgi:hypothetical protein